jgi:hypothetical protein
MTVDGHDARTLRQTAALQPQQKDLALLGELNHGSHTTFLSVTAIAR